MVSPNHRHSRSTTSMIPGYHGCYLHVDLTQGVAEQRQLSTPTLRRYLGGSGLATHLLLKHGGDQWEACDARSPLVFAYSPLVGSPLTTSAKFTVASRSPLTGFINDSLVSSAFALAGKRVGVDAMVIVGRCEVPSMLVVNGDQLELQPAASIWGLPCRVAETVCREALGPDFQLAVIGPAGELGVRYATISHDGRHAGRGGNGAVMGAKNLKAIAVRGEKHVSWAFPDALHRIAKDLSGRSLGAATAKYRELGTAANLVVLNRLGALPTRNFQSGQFEFAEPLDPITLRSSSQHTRASCVACTIGCEHMYKPSSAPAGTVPVRLEYENLYALGPLCGIHDISVVLAASQRCDDYGLDTISTGGTIAFAMECAEHGWWDVPWLRFGDGEALLRSIDLIGRGEGIGIELGLGSRALSRRLGAQAEAIAPHVKGLEMPGYEPRSAQAMALGFAVGTRGADHNRSGAYQVDFSEKVDRFHLRAEDVRHVVETEDQAALMDSAIFCKFLRGVFQDFFADIAECLRCVTGWDVSADELRTTARRIVALKKAFNIRAGWHPRDDRLPQRILEQAPIHDAEARLTSGQLQALIAAYNLQRGWTEEGWMPDDLWSELELEAPPGGT